MVLKKSLNEDRERMDAAYEAHRHLLAREMRGPGDTEAAMHRLQAKYGLDYWKQWMARYKRVASPEFIEQLRQAYLSTLERSVRRDLESLKGEEAKSGGNDADLGNLVAEAEALLAKIKRKREGVKA